MRCLISSFFQISQAGPLSVSANSSTPDNAASIFIAEAVSSATPTLQGSALSVSSSETSDLKHKEDLQFRQSRLEQMIAQSRVFMHRLNKAQSREERENILQKIREINRYFPLFSVFFGQIHEC